MARYCANVWVEVDEEEDPVTLEDLRDHLAEAVDLDLNTEEHGSLGVVGIEIDWDSLRAG